MVLELGDEALKYVADQGVTVSEVDLAPFKTAVAGVYDMLDLTEEAAIVNDVLGR